MKNHIDSYTFWGDNVEIFHCTHILHTGEYITKKDRGKRK